MIQVLDKSFEPYIDAAKIDIATSRIAQEIIRDYKDKNPLLVCVLNGAFIFASDLIKKIDIPCQIEFIKVKSYQGTKSKGNVEWLLDLNEDISERDVILIEDIVDTGYSLDSMYKVLQTKSPSSIKIASLLFKKDAYTKDYPIDYCGFEIENKFIIGYGMDYNEYGRNIPEIYILKS